MLHLPASEVCDKITHQDYHVFHGLRIYRYITYVISSLCINGQHKNDYELRTMTAALPNQGTIYGHFLPIFHSSVFNS